MNIGLVPISAKPYHKGHHYLIAEASKNNDVVLVFVSTSDRLREGEFPIYGDDMKKVWFEEIESIVPDNVRIDYGGSPVRKVYETISGACQDLDDNVYTIYSDCEDTKVNYPLPYREKYMQPLFGLNQIKFASEENPDSFSRGVGAPDISATEIRSYLDSGDFEKFADLIPDGINKMNVYEILTKAKKREDSDLRNFVKMALKF